VLEHGSGFPPATTADSHFVLGNVLACMEKVNIAKLEPCLMKTKILHEINALKLVKDNYPETFQRFECRLCLLSSVNHLTSLNMEFQLLLACPLLILVLAEFNQPS